MITKFSQRWVDCLFLRLTVCEEVTTISGEVVYQKRLGESSLR